MSNTNKLTTLFSWVVYQEFVSYFYKLATWLVIFPLVLKKDRMMRCLPSLRQKSIVGSACDL